MLRRSGGTCRAPSPPPRRQADAGPAAPRTGPPRAAGELRSGRATARCPVRQLGRSRAGRRPSRMPAARLRARRPAARATAPGRAPPARTTRRGSLLCGSAPGDGGCRPARCGRAGSRAPPGPTRAGTARRRASCRRRPPPRSAPASRRPGPRTRPAACTPHAPCSRRSSGRPAPGEPGPIGAKNGLPLRRALAAPWPPGPYNQVQGHMKIRHGTLFPIDHCPAGHGLSSNRAGPVSGPGARPPTRASRWNWSDRSMPDLSQTRERMVEIQIARRGVRDPRVLKAIREVPREAFVESGFEEFAYEDGPLPIGEGQTISQPYVVALMIEAAELEPSDRVLEVGAGSGYAAAVLSRIAARVHAIERHPELAASARRRLTELGYRNVDLHVGDGTRGWPEAAPFDAILVSAGGPDVPPALQEQLAIGGRLIIPVGREEGQQLRKITRTAAADYEEEALGTVAFVPLIGEQGWSEDGS